MKVIVDYCSSRGLRYLVEVKFVFSSGFRGGGLELRVGVVGVGFTEETGLEGRFEFWVGFG